ncbi:MAG: nitroreductase [Oscillospiraceae bacterium]|jgi:nitroreductase|nr:nitroreductase [Oscillospiraceae bacterium]
MNDTIKTILNRRSIRKFKQEQIRDEELNAILEAGMYAPSGGNCQYTNLTVIQNRRILDELKAIVQNEFSKMEITDGMYKSIVSAIKAAKKGGYDYDYNAPTFIIVSNKREHRNAMADSCAAIENILLAAASIGLGTCWINQLRWLSDNENVIKFLETIGIDSTQKVCGCISVGYPDQPNPKAAPRREDIVRIIK